MAVHITSHVICLCLISVLTHSLTPPIATHILTCPLHTKNTQRTKSNYPRSTHRAPPPNAFQSFLCAETRKRIHDLSRRRPPPFIHPHCGSVSGSGRKGGAWGNVRGREGGCTGGAGGAPYSPSAPPGVSGHRSSLQIVVQTFSEQWSRVANPKEKHEPSSKTYSYVNTYSTSRSELHPRLYLDRTEDRHCENIHPQQSTPLPFA